MGDEDHWAANVAVWSLAKAGARAVAFLSGKLAPATPLTGRRLADLRIQLADVDGLTRMNAARALLDRGLALQPAEILVLLSVEEEASRSNVGRLVYGGLLPFTLGGRNVSTVRVDDLDRSPLPDRLRSARAIAALGYSTAPRNARRLLESLVAGHAEDPQTVDAVSALRLIGSR